jgi:hypothetical protein
MDDLVMKRKLDSNDLRKREFDRRLEREMRAIDKVISSAKYFTKNNHFKSILQADQSVNTDAEGMTMDTKKRGHSRRSSSVGIQNDILKDYD